MKLVYIFAAGASASINESVPVMANFFEKAVGTLVRQANKKGGRDNISVILVQNE